MDYCPLCRRHLNGALACPGCGAPAGYHPHAPGHPHGPGPGTAPWQGAAPAHGAAPGQTPPVPPAEQVYRAKPFPHDPPPEAVPAHLAGGAADEGGDVRSDHDDPYGDAGDERDDTGPVGRGGRRTRGRRARRGRGKRVFLLAACLGTVLLGVSVAEIGSPVLPWSEPATSGPDTQVIGQAGAASESPDEKKSGTPSGAASADSPTTPEADASSASASASPSGEPSPTESSEPSPEPTEITGTVAPEPAEPTPTEPPQETSDPTPPEQDDPEPPDDDYDDCWLVFCS